MDAGHNLLFNCAKESLRTAAYRVTNDCPGGSTASVSHNLRGKTSGGQRRHFSLNGRRCDGHATHWVGLPADAPTAVGCPDRDCRKPNQIDAAEAGFCSCFYSICSSTILIGSKSTFPVCFRPDAFDTNTMAGHGQFGEFRQVDNGMCLDHLRLNTRK